MTTTPQPILRPWSCRRPLRCTQLSHREENDMRKFIARQLLRATSKRYDYDTTYLELMLEKSPSAFFKFASAAKAAGYREVVPAEASFTAKIVGAMAEDCGPCTQLVVNMAL